MSEAIFSFKGELIGFLPKQLRREEIKVVFHGHETVKHLIESLGIPHTEVDVILVNSSPVEFGTRLNDGDFVTIFPVFETVVGDSLLRLQPAEVTLPRFVIDCHLGKLASYLRLLGFDSLYQNNFNDNELAKISNCEDRILLTRDRGLLKRNQVKHGYCVRSKIPKIQVNEIIRRYDLTEKIRPLSRCAKCNGLLIAVGKVDVLDRLEPKTKLYYEEFKKCEQCDKIFWKGSHFLKLEPQIQAFIDFGKS